MREADTIESARFNSWSRQCSVGALFWLCVALALEPGNLMHGMPPTWSHEVIRLSMASLLFGSAGPAIFWLVKTWPVRSWRKSWVLGWHAVAISVLALVYLTVGHILAQLVLEGPGFRHLQQEIAANFALLFACLAALDFAVHFITPKKPNSGFIRHITVKSKQGSFQLSLAQVEHMEAQENYVALHTATDTHLVRVTLSSLIEKLDPALFTRVHRSTVINRACIQKIKSIGNGKLQLTLHSGTETIVSRAYSSALRGLWGSSS